ncbi:MAG: hypothetical protein ACRD63_15525, partial [Pyrinomonadaceae bacterium]
MLRLTTTNYLAFSDNNYKANNLLNLPANIIIANGQGITMGETIFRYDQLPLAASGVSTQFNINPAAGTTRGNLTSVSRWLNTNNIFITGTTSYFDTGMVEKVTDPLGAATNFAYSLNFAGAYLTQITNALGHVSTSNYDFNTGLVTSQTDANGQTTSYEYNDVLDRITRVGRPDGGSTRYAYGDAPGNLFVNTQMALDSTRILDAYVYFDGLGRANRTFQNESGAWLVSDTQYDALGRVSRVSNPYRSPQGIEGPVNPSGLWTTTQYDGLGRVTAVTTPDGAAVRTSYNGNTVTVTDQTGRSRRSVTDALGRLTAVYEDPFGVNYETSYTYDALDNLR